MTEELYVKLLEILTLGNLKYQESESELATSEHFILIYQLQNKYKLEDYAQVVQEFITWYNNQKENEYERGYNAGWIDCLNEYTEKGLIY